MCDALLGLGTCLVQKTKSLTLYRFANIMDDRKPFIYICPVHFTPKCIYIYLFLFNYIYRLYISGHSIVLTFGLVLSYPKIGGHLTAFSSTPYT
jgi:putative effector of murein hydrolase